MSDSLLSQCSIKYFQLYTSELVCFNVVAQTAVIFLLGRFSSAPVTIPLPPLSQSLAPLFRCL